MKNVIQTIGENCQDCYRCVRACPVKAIMISDAQAHIVDDLCIHCGTCVRVCPKEAKTSVVEKLKAPVPEHEKKIKSQCPCMER